MAFLNGALNPLRMLGRQSMSYGGSVARSGIRLSRAITKDALSHGMATYAIGGAVVGGGLSAADNYSNRGGRGIVGATLRGAALGAAGGAGVRLGLSAYGMRNSGAARAFGMRLRGGLSGRQAVNPTMGSRNAFTAMRFSGTDAGTLASSSVTAGAKAMYGRAVSGWGRMKGMF